jgi:hypothetical protein
VSVNSIRSAASAGIAGSIVDATGALRVHAQREDELTAVTVGAAVSISGSGTFTLTGTAAVTTSLNETSGSGVATIADGSDVSAGSVEVSAQDASTLTVDTAAVSLSASGSGGGAVSLALAAAAAENKMGSRTAATIAHSEVSSAGTIGVLANNAATMHALAAGIGVSISVGGLFAISGAANGAVALNQITGATEARITAGSDVAATGDITVSATDTTTLDADAHAVSVSVGISIAGLINGLTGSGLSFVFSMAAGVTAVDNDIAGTVHAAIDDSSARSSAGAILVTAAGEGTADVRATSESVSVAGDVLASVSIALAASVATNTIGSEVSASIDGSDAGVTASGNVTVQAADHRRLHSATASGAVSISGGAATSAFAIALSTAINEVGGSVRAAIESSEVSSNTGAVVVDALSATEVDALAVGVSVSVAAGGLAIGVAGAGAAAVNDTHAATEASIGQSTVQAPGAVTIQALDDVDVFGQAIAVAIAAASSGGFGLSLAGAAAGSVAINTHTARTEAGVDGSTVTSTGARVGVEARSATSLVAMPDAVALALSTDATSFSLSGSAAVARNATVAKTPGSPGAMIGAFVRNGSAVSGTTVEVRARDELDANAELVSLSASVGGASGAVAMGVAENELDTMTSASITGSTVMATAGDILIDADATQDIDAQSIAVALSVGFVGFAGTGAVATTEIRGDVAAFAHDATLAATGTVRIDADSNQIANAVAAGAAVSASFGAGVAVMEATAEIDGATRAYAGGALTIQSAALEVTADSSSQALPDGVAVAVGFGGSGTGAVIDGRVSRLTEAFVGTRVGTAPGVLSTLTVGGGDVLIDAGSTSTVTTMPVSLGIGGVNVSTAITQATIDGATLAYVGANTRVNAGELDIMASSTESATADNVLVSLGGAFAVGVSESTATIDSDTEAFTGTRASRAPIAGAATTIVLTQAGNGDGTARVAASGSHTTTATASGGSASFGITVNVFLPTADTSGSVRAYAGENTVLTADDLTVTADAPVMMANASITAGSIAGFATVDVLQSLAKVTGEVEAFIGAQSSELVSAAPVINVSGAHSSDGDVVVDANSAMTANASLLGASASFGLNVDVVNPQAEVSGKTRAYVREGAAVTADTLSVEAGKNRDRVDYTANATVFTADFAGLASISVVDSDANVQGVVEAFVGAPSGHTAPDALSGAKLDIGGSVQVTSMSSFTADAVIDGGSGGSMTVTVLRLAADAGGVTRAYAGDGLDLEASRLDISADGAATADADVFNLNFSLIAAVTDIIPVARTSHIVEAYIGETRDTARPDQAKVQVRNTSGGRGTINVDATASTLADAEIFGVSGSFGVTVNVIQPKAEMVGATRAYIGPRTDLSAGPVTLEAHETSARAVAKMSGGSGALIANVSVIRAEAAASRLTEAFVGHHADVDLGGDSLTAHAALNTGAPLAEATIATGSGGGIANVSDFVVEGRVGLVDSADGSSQASATRTFVGDHAVITAGALTLEADSDTEAQADVSQPVGFGGLVNVGLIDVTGVAAHDTEAYVGDDVALTLSGALRIDAHATTTATPSVANHSASLGVSYAESHVTTRIDSDTRAWIGAAGTITASSVRVVADAEHDARAEIDTGGFSGVVSIGDLVARAVDTGSVSARIGPSGGGSSGNRSVVTATGAGGIDVDATLDSRVTSSPDLGSFSLLAGGGKSESFADNDSSVEARIGDWADLQATSDALDVLAALRGVAKAEAASTAAAAGVAVSFANADATFRPNVDLTVGSNADLFAGGSSPINLTARLNHDGTNFLTNATSPGFGAIGDAQKLAFAALGAGSDSTVTALADAALLIDVGTNARFDAATGDINVQGRNSNTAFATLSSISGALVAVSLGDVTPTANGATAVRFTGDVGDGSASGANNLNILAEAFTTADTAFAASNGGLVSVTDTGSAFSKVDAAMTLDFGSSASDIVVSGDIHVLAIQTTDADAKTHAGSGGFVDVASLDTAVEANADVDVSVGATHKVHAGGLIHILAQHGALAVEVSDGTVIATIGANPVAGAQTAGNTNYVDFGVAHKLNQGATITFNGSGGGLINEREYTVIVRDANTLHLGGTFTGSVNTLFDTITIDNHNFQTGDFVYYHANGLDEVGGLDTGQRHRVFVVDGDRIKLQAPGMATPSLTVSRGAIGADGSPSDDTVLASNGFTAPNQPVTYRVPAPQEFSADFVDVNVTLDDPSTPTTNEFAITTDSQNRIFMPGHGFSAGQQVVYRADGPNTIVVSGPAADLVDGGMYFVANGGSAIGSSPGFAFDANYIRLARTLNDAIGFINNNGTPSNPADDFYVGPSVMDLVRTTTDPTVHSLRALNNEPLSGLTDGRSYYVVNRTGTSFQLASSAGGTPIAFSNGGVSGGSHTFAIEGLDLTASGGFGDHDLVLDIEDGATGFFDGVGGARAVTGAPSGDRTVTASTTGAAGGAIQIGSADATARAWANTDISVARGAHVSGRNIIVETDSFLAVSAASDGAGGGGISIGDATTVARGENNSLIDISTDAVLSALDDLIVSARTNSDVDAFSTTGNFGLGAGADADSEATLQYNTRTLVDGDLTAGDQLTVETRVTADVQAESEADGGGLGVDGNAEADVRIGYKPNIDSETIETNALSQTEVGGAANLLGKRVLVASYVDKLRGRAFAETDVTALGADADADADSYAAGRNETLLLDGSEITGSESITIHSEFARIDNTARSDADLDALGGDTDSFADVDLNTRAKVEGHWEAKLRTAELVVHALQTNVISDASARRSGAVFDGGDSGEDNDPQDARREIFWESHVYLLGEPNPELEIAETGEIVKSTNVEFLGANAGKSVGDSVVGDQIILQDIVYDQAGTVTFFANNLSGAPDGVIWGNHGLIESQRTWDDVRLINDSVLDLVMNHIDTSDGASVVDIQVNDIRFTDGYPDNVSLDPDTPGATFEFDLNLFYPQTEVEIRNRTAGNREDSDIILLGGIENTIGLTTIENQRGNIRVDERDLVGEQGALPRAIFDEGLIRTNTLYVDASGDIGNQSASGGRSALMVELVRITHATERGEVLTLREVDLEADAGGDAVLDITLHDRSLYPAATSLAVTVDRITAGDDVDVVVSDSKAGDNLSDIDGVTVRTFDPSDLVTTKVRTGEYWDHFSDDVVGDTLYNFIRRTVGTSANEVDSTYSFLEVRAGDDIDIGHVDTTAPFGEPRAYITSMIGGSPYGAVVTEDTVPGTTVHFVVNTDVDWTGGVSEDGIEQIFLTTNGDITATELAGDMLVGHIHSTTGDVTLTSPQRILDADSQPTIDVTGDDITMIAGTGGTISNPGRVGQMIDFLELNVNRDNGVGVLTVTDTAAGPGAGIYLDDVLGDLRVDLVQTKADVSLRTVGGSILQGTQNGASGDRDFAADVIGNAIDLDANGAASDIGELDKDLDIDSRAGTGGVGDVGVEATRHIYLTETVAALDLVLAHTDTGDIRLTVRESAAQGEDLNLLELGSARFAESNTRLPGHDPDAPRVVPHGLIFAENGKVTLRVGDNVTLDDNSAIVADKSIAIFGDYNSADPTNTINGDPGWGTTLILRGQIVADAVATAGDPVGSWGANTAGPAWQTNIWGHTDVDTFQFGDASGITGTTVWGQDGFVYLGAKTRVHGSQDADSSGDDGEDRFLVYYLQDMDATSAPANAATTPNADHTLTLDGQADSDSYTVFTTGSRGNARNYAINVLDTGASDDGVDTLSVFGFDQTNPNFIGYASGTTTRNPNDDLFLLRAATAIFGEPADHPAFVALLHGGVTNYRDTVTGNEPSSEVQRINYDAALNGRLSVFGLGGNDMFFVDDNSATTALDGGAGYDSFQIGQIFGSKRDGSEGALLADDVFPDLIATTRGWLSPGTHAPLVATGGTGNDEFTVYSNQAELRLEGDDDNDLFVVRAFALAAVSTKDWNGDGTIDAADLGAVHVDTNGDGTINATDADETPDDWRDDTIVLQLQDGRLVAVPKIGSGFSTGKPLDIRSGGGEDEIQYNVNAPVSVDGGTGFDKLVILGTEFADDIVITDQGIFGAGLNVRYSTVEVVEIDGLEGDDEFFVQSTAFGVAYRVIGGLGSDTINVTGDVVEDIVTRELEGASGAIDHLVMSGDVNYNGLSVDGLDYNVATANGGLVIIKETDGFSTITEDGAMSLVGTRLALDMYTVRLAKAPTADVYITISAARAQEEEENDTFANPSPLPNGQADTLWLSTSLSGLPVEGDFDRDIMLNGALVHVPQRAIVLHFTPSNWNTEQHVYLYAKDDPRSEGDRVVVVQHSVIAPNPADAVFDAVAVRNVEVTVRDNDTPGVYVTEIDPVSGQEDRRTLVIEGTSSTQLTDAILVELARQPVGTVTLELVLDADAQKAMLLSGPEEGGRFHTVASASGTRYFVTFDASNWDAPIRVNEQARNEPDREDPQRAVISVKLYNAQSTPAAGVALTTDAAYVVPNLRSGPGRLDVEVIDNDTAGVVTLESGGSTLLVRDDPLQPGDQTATDHYMIRLTMPPTTTVPVAILTDGLADVLSIGGVPATLQEVGSDVASPAFQGTIVFASVAGQATLTRGVGAELGSFSDEGFAAGDFIRVSGAGAHNGDFYVQSVSADGQTLTLTTALAGPSGAMADVVLSHLASVGTFEGSATLDAGQRQLIRGSVTGSQPGWLADGFLEGRRVRVYDAANVANFVDLKIRLISGDNNARDNTLTFTSEGGVLPGWWNGTQNVRVVRLAAVATFSADPNAANAWYKLQDVVLTPDSHYEVPPTRAGVKVFPASTHLLSKLAGPLAVEGGVIGVDRSLQNGVKLPGEADTALIEIGPQPPESRAIDVLNIFNDSSQQDRTGTMTATTLSGFGMAQDLDFSARLEPLHPQTFGEPAVFPGGISFGTVSYVNGQFQTDGSQSTIEVVNFLGGEGNDNLTITGTLNPTATPDPQVQHIGSVTIASHVPAHAADYTATITRSDAARWADNGFQVGQLVRIAGDSGAWRLGGFDGTGRVMQLRGSALPAALAGTTAERTVFVAGQHGGLTVVHGGGNMPLTITPDVTTTASSVERLDGGSWIASGYAVGQWVQTSGESDTRQIVGFASGTAAYVNPYPGQGTDAVMLLGGAPIAANANVARTVHVSEPFKEGFTGLATVHTTGITRTSGSWSSDGFEVGQPVWISGIAGAFTITGITDGATGSTISFGAGNAALMPTFTPQTLAVFGYDPKKDGGARLGGDTIAVTGGAGPDSPLVVYGDTSQDGVWYSGHPFDALGMEFGEKPFDPFSNLPDADNEDDEWVFPLANPYKFAGNDIINASALFAGMAPNQLPSVGLTAYGGAGHDLIIGSQAGDHLAGGSGDDEIHGQRGVDHIYGDSGVNVDILTRALTISTSNASPRRTLDLALINFISNGTTIEPYASPVRDLLIAGRDLIYGDGPGTVTGGPEWAYDDIIFGDHGALLQNVADPNLPDARPQKIQTTTLDSVLLIRSRQLQNGNDDAIFGNLGRDIIIAGAGHDMADGDEADDLVFGDNVTTLTRMGGADGDLGDDTASQRFQTLLGGLLYSRSDQQAAHAGAPAPHGDASGQLLNDGMARTYRDPDGAPWWAEYTIDYAALHTFAFDQGTAGVGSFGNDYLAGGAQHDLLFGQLGNDVIQGDGGIESAVAATAHVGASRTAGGPSDPIGPLTVVPSFEAATDGEDLTEGGGGNDVIFGGLGQDDIVGGSSDFFSLIAAHNRPDGDDYVFGGAGVQIDRNDEDLPLGTAASQRHGRDADVIAGDNANIVRIVGVNGVDVNPTVNPAQPLYVRFTYDNYDTSMKAVVRGVTLLDYTPGGPTFRSDLFALVNPNDPMFRAEFDIWAQIDIGGHDEVHGETGDDTVYTGGGQDRIFGGADDDDLIGGWGNDWISGGSGQDGVIGDDGRIFTSRNTAGNIAQYSEPLYAVHFLLASDPDTRTSQGNVINEFVYTPGQVQTATLNVNQALNKTVDITPFNLTPNAQGADNPLFDPIFADDIIFGGLGEDFLHGAAGDDAIAGGEALPESYTQRFDSTGNLRGLVRTDFTRPWNPGDILKFGSDTDPWNAPKPAQSRLGEFSLYDEYDPRRAILFNDDGSVWKEGAPTGKKRYFLTLVSDEGPLVNGAVAFAPSGTPTAFADRNTDGSDVIFGDLGNDWLVGGTGKDTLWGGWGNDLLNADDVLETNGALNDTTDPHPVYEDRAFGGAGLDVLIGNTGGDRLIDWVGEFNSYIVPFAPFGIATVSRQVPPQLFEFLYALSASQGADPTRDTDTGNSASRNGEPDGELGLIVQKDHGLWQDQTGGPTDPQPGNIPGGRRDVLRSADFNGGQMQGVAVDSGVWQVGNGALSVAAAALGQDAAAVFYADVYLPIYYEIKADVTVQKPTAGWKANAYVLFDYFSPIDFKFAGIDVSTNKLVMGRRTAQAWVVDTQASVPGSLKPDTPYPMLIAVNGTVVTVSLNNRQVFSHTFAPRLLNEETVGLNKGLIGVGSDNARGIFDNLAVQVLPPQITLDLTEDFNDGLAQQFTGLQAGTWTVSGGRYASTAAAGTTTLAAINLGAAIAATSYAELQATLRTSGIGGVIFDAYAPNDFKFVALDIASQKVLVGHVDPRRGWVVDTAVSRTLVAGTDYALQLVLSATSVSVTVGGALVTSYGFNGAVVDGAVGVLARGSTTSLDSFRLRTNDPAFASAPAPLLASEAAPATAGTVPTVSAAELQPVLAAARQHWLATGLVDATAFDAITVRIADLGTQDTLRLGQAVGNLITLDDNGAGWGWFVDLTPDGATEFRWHHGDGTLVAMPSSVAFARMDLFTVVMHELGHVLGFAHAGSPAGGVMAETLAPGVRQRIGDGQTAPEPSLPAVEVLEMAGRITPRMPTSAPDRVGTADGADTPHGEAFPDAPLPAALVVDAVSVTVPPRRPAPHTWWSRVQRLFWRNTSPEEAMLATADGQARAFATLQTSQPVPHIDWNQPMVETMGKTPRTKPALF